MAPADTADTLVSSYYPPATRLAVDAAIVSGWSADTTDTYCTRCGASAGPGAATPKGCPFCVDTPIPWDRLTRLGLYAEPLDGWVRQLKYRRQWTWAPWFGRELAVRLPSPTDGQQPVVCHAPMHWTRRVWRGYDQAQLLARAVAEARGWPHAELLRRTRRTRPQTMINQRYRHENVRGAFSIPRVDLTGHDVYLVDDVKTSGATLKTCTRLLREAGAGAVRVAVVAVADPRGQRFETV